MPQTYSSYLEVDALLDLQRPKSDGPEHDEMLFIVVHQVYELWFKQILHEGDNLVNLLGAGHLVASTRTLARILKILKVMVSQVDIMETMSPLEFSSFRARLDTASGFQSVQFREFEMLVGKRDPKLLARFENDAAASRRLADRGQKQSIWQAFCDLLRVRGFDLPEGVGAPGPTGAQASEAVQKVLVEVYRERDSLAELAEALVDLDEGIQEWRYRHVKMVERTIGGKPGTGGSMGAAYLRSTLMLPIFPDLWAVRNML